MASDRRRLLGNMASLFTLQGTNYILPLIIIPYLVRVLGPEKYGLVVFAQAVIQYFVIVTDYGFNMSATRDVALHRNDPDQVNQIISTVILIKFLLALIGAIFLTIMIFTIGNLYHHYTLYLAVYLTVIGSTIFPTWLFQGLERMRELTVLNIVSRLVTTAAIFIVVQKPNDYTVAATLQSVPGILASIPAWYIIRRDGLGKYRAPSLSEIKSQLKSGYHLFLSSMSVNVYTTSNIVILGIFGGPTEVGYFSPAYKLVLAIFGLLSPITQTLYPHISSIAKTSMKDAISFSRRLIWPIAGFGITASLIIYLFSGAIISTLFGKDYAQSIIILQLFSAIPLAVALSNLFGTLTMLPLGMSKQFSRILFQAATFNIFLSACLTYAYSGNGTAMAMVLTEYLVTILMLVTLCKVGILCKSATVLSYDGANRPADELEIK